MRLNKGCSYNFRIAQYISANKFEIGNQTKLNSIEDDTNDLCFKELFAH